MAYKIKQSKKKEKKTYLVDNSKNWEKDERGDYSVVFRNKKNPSLTYEIHKLDDEFAKEINSKYYCFPAVDGKGIPTSPDLAQTKKEALELAKEYIKEN